RWIERTVLAARLAPSAGSEGKAATTRVVPISAGTPPNAWTLSSTTPRAATAWEGDSVAAGEATSVQRDVTGRRPAGASARRAPRGAAAAGASGRRPYFSRR